MAIIDADGFETGLQLISNTNHPALTTSTGLLVGRDGVGVGVRANTTTNMTKTFVAGSDRLYFHLGCYIGNTQLGSTTATAEIWQLRGDVGVTSHLTATWSSTGQVQLRRGTSSGTVIATSTQAMGSGTDGVWVSMQVTALVHDTTGECIIKVNGDTWITFNGDTKNAGTATRLDTVLFGVGAGSVSWGVDDWLLCDTTGGVNDTWTGEISIVGGRAAGNGANSGLTGSDGNSVNNYQQVDDYPLDAADYNGSTTVTAIDTYDMTALGKTGTVLAVQELVYAAKSDAGAKSFKHVQVGGSAGTVKSSAVTLSTSYTVYAGPIWLTDGDGNAWTTARVDASEFGFEVA